MIVDKRELRIVLQNSMAHATRIAINNAKGENIDPKDVFDMAVKIALLVLTYDGSKSQPNETKE